MAVIEKLEVKLHVTTLGIPELEHLLAMLNANVENLPTIVVKAMIALAESVGVEPKKQEVTIAPISISGGICAEQFKAALRSNDHAKAVE